MLLETVCNTAKELNINNNAKGNAKALINVETNKEANFSFCRDAHLNFQGPNFEKMTVGDRWEETKRLQMCWSLRIKRWPI